MEHKLNQNTNDWATCTCGKTFKDTEDSTAMEKLEMHVEENTHIKEQELQKEIKEPEIEKIQIQKEISNQDINDDMVIDEELEHKMEDIRKRPYGAVRETFEARYPFWGGKIWSILALIIITLIMPKIPRGEKMIKNRSSAMIFGTPGIGKTQTAEDFQRVAFNCLYYESVTPARLYGDIIDMKTSEDDIPQLSFACSDVTGMMNDPELVKLLEQILGEDNSISRANMRNRSQGSRVRVDIIGYLSGTMDLMKNQKISRGLMFRALTLIILYTKEQHEKILDHVNNKMGIEKKSKDFEHIIRYYRELWDIQHNKNAKIKPVTGYIISDEIRRNVGEFIKPTVEKAFDKYSITFVRTLEETYRMMCASAMLNIYNRKVIDGKIKIETEDVELAKKIIQRDIAHKIKILQTISSMDLFGINDLTDLRKWVESMSNSGKSIPEDTQLIMKSIIEETQNKRKIHRN